ncbi:hypothetical protein M5K25_016836 [Dendrobium thyrsiflorum]|uniref:Uncharacterized protein n=1 Tax=Dendrobium thyrsiflorum TaxID=117978 RepID=A0ABD0UT40_DENTH
MVEEILTIIDKNHPPSPSKSHILEDVLKPQCVKYLEGEYKKKYDAKIRKMKALEEQLVKCRAELATMVTSAFLQSHQMDHLHIELMDAQVTINQHAKDHHIIDEKLIAIENENKRLQSLLVIEEFKKSVAFKMIVQDHIQEARDHIYGVEVKALELECMEEGFIRGTIRFDHVCYVMSCYEEILSDTGEALSATASQSDRETTPMGFDLRLPDSVTIANEAEPKSAVEDTASDGAKKAGSEAKGMRRDLADRTMAA